MTFDERNEHDRRLLGYWSDVLRYLAATDERGAPLDPARKKNREYARSQVRRLGVRTGPVRLLGD